MRAHVVGRDVCAATLILHTSEGLRLRWCACLSLCLCLCLCLSHLLKFIANPDTDASIRTLMGGAKGGGDRVSFAPFVTDKQQFLSVAQVRVSLLSAIRAQLFVMFLHPQ